MDKKVCVVELPESVVDKIKLRADAELRSVTGLINFMIDCYKQGSVIPVDVFEAIKLPGIKKRIHLYIEDKQAKKVKDTAIQEHRSSYTTLQIMIISQLQL
jgi:hypothetical protein